ncbi:hypothetical protein PC128_g22942 [Phytophthora cactorum]|nr:hypothetical protein PC120_g20914 [Phytophthora cactorum]KAG3053036.1 hypothetical protein PC121_g17008 [Phytophthora cactorum]KAG3151678.1 hypothetical protein PC128_g22942 [Phytophthora cactorum]KAG4049710.1 hypothetical protein PC123_g15023 [Phytophthora cactorum]
MPFVVHMQMLDSLNFDNNLSVLGTTAGARFGPYGVSIMH